MQDSLQIVIIVPQVATPVTLSCDQARTLAQTLLAQIETAEREARVAQVQARLRRAEAVPVDRSDTVLTDGSPVTADHRERLPNGQQKDYVVLSVAERAKGFVRPVRRVYQHLSCNGVTTMNQALAETYARDPGFYTGTFCATCREHFPLDQFVWDGTNDLVGS